MRKCINGQVFNDCNLDLLIGDQSIYDIAEEFEGQIVRLTIESDPDHLELETDESN